MPEIAEMSAWVLAGLAMGAWHLVSLRWVGAILTQPVGSRRPSRATVAPWRGLPVRMWTTTPTWLRLASLQLLRGGVVLVVCVAAARHGAAPLLALAAGASVAIAIGVFRAARVTGDAR